MKKEKMKKTTKNNTMQTIASILGSNLLRAIKLFPNNDPLMGFGLPLAKKSIIKATIFAFATMMIFDYFTSGIGMWSWVTAITYSMIMVFAGAIMKILKNNKKEIKMKEYVKINTAGILIFDIITGPIMSSTLFKTPFIVTAIAQVPFTAMHLLSGTIWLIILVPILDPTVNQNLNVIKAINKFTKKIQQITKHYLR